MSDEAPKTRKRRAPQGPRQAKPLYLLVSYTDTDGTPVPLEASRIKIVATKNAEEVATAVMEAATNGGAMPAMVKWTPPSAA